MVERIIRSADLDVEHFCLDKYTLTQNTLTIRRKDNVYITIEFKGTLYEPYDSKITGVYKNTDGGGSGNKVC